MAKKKHIVKIEICNPKISQREAEYLIDTVINLGLECVAANQYDSIRVLFKGADYV